MPTQNDRHTISDLYQMQSLPLEIKVRMTQRRIRDWVEYWGEDGVYVSFSGGKDSTVLLDICRRMYPNIVAVYSDTGLEFPEIREFVKTKDNVVCKAGAHVPQGHREMRISLYLEGAGGMDTPDPSRPEEHARYPEILLRHTHQRPALPLQDFGAVEIHAERALRHWRRLLQ